MAYAILFRYLTIELDELIPSCLLLGDGNVERMDVHINSVRLDKYYSHSSISETFGDAQVYVIPKKNGTLKGPWKWKRKLFGFVSDVLN